MEKRRTRESTSVGGCGRERGWPGWCGDRSGKDLLHAGGGDGRGGDGIRIRNGGGGLAGLQAEVRGELAEEGLFIRAGGAVRLAHADGHYIGELFPLREIQRLRGLPGIRLAEDGTLIERGGVRLRRQRAFANAFQLLPLGVRRAAIREGGQQTDGVERFFTGQGGGRMIGHRPELAEDGGRRK